MLENNTTPGALFAVQVALDTTRENPQHSEVAKLLINELIEGIVVSRKQREGGRLTQTGENAIELLLDTLSFIRILEQRDQDEFDRTGNSFLGKRRADWPGR